MEDVEDGEIVDTPKDAQKKSPVGKGRQNIEGSSSPAEQKQKTLDMMELEEGENDVSKGKQDGGSVEREEGEIVDAAEDREHAKEEGEIIDTLKEDIMMSWNPDGRQKQQTDADVPSPPLKRRKVSRSTNEQDVPVADEIEVKDGEVSLGRTLVLDSSQQSDIRKVTHRLSHSAENSPINAGNNKKVQYKRKLGFSYTRNDSKSSKRGGSNVTRVKGKVCNVLAKRGFGFVETPDHIDAIFYLNHLNITWFLPLKIGDVLDFGLGKKFNGEEIRAIARNPKLAQCVSRDKETIDTFLTDIMEYLGVHSSYIFDAGGDDNEDTKDNPPFLTELLCCTAVAHAIGQGVSEKSVPKVIELLSWLKGNVASKSEYFKGFLSALLDSKFFRGSDCVLGRFIRACSEDSVQYDSLKMKEFFKILIQTLPQNAAVVARLVAPLVSVDKDTDEAFLYGMWCESVKGTTKEAAHKAWNELPLVLDRSELPLEGPFETLTDLSPVVDSYQSVDEYVDTYFRLLRADCFEAVRRGIHDWMHGRLNPKDMNVYDNVAVVGVLPSDTEIGIQVALKVCPKTPVQNWSSGSKLMFGNLLCLSATGTFSDAMWATVGSRDETLLKQKNVIFVELCSEWNSIDIVECVTTLVRSSGRLLMVESPTYYRAYQPVLRALQAMDPRNLPFREELVSADNFSVLPKYITEFSTIDGKIIDKNLPKCCNFEFLVQRNCFTHPTCADTATERGSISTIEEGTRKEGSTTIDDNGKSCRSNGNSVPRIDSVQSEPLGGASEVQEIEEGTREGSMLDDCSNTKSDGESVLSTDPVQSKSANGANEVQGPADTGKCEQVAVTTTDDDSSSNRQIVGDSEAGETACAIEMTVTTTTTTASMPESSKDTPAKSPEMPLASTAPNSPNHPLSLPEDLMTSFLETDDDDDDITLDESQLHAIRLALSQRVGIIQGPPGTGKTFIGVQLVKLIRSISTVPNSPILVLTYKNHALDEFLKQLIPLCPGSLVRVGGRSTDPELERYNLNELRKYNGSYVHVGSRRRSKNWYFERNYSREIRIIKSEQETVQNSVTKALQRLWDSQFLPTNLHLCIMEAFDGTKIRHLIESCDRRMLGVKYGRVRQLLRRYDSEELKFALFTEEDDIASSDLKTLFERAIKSWIPDENIFDHLERSSRPLHFSFRSNNRRQDNSQRSNNSKKTDMEDEGDDFLREQNERILSSVPLSKRSKKESIVWLENTIAEKNVRLPAVSPDLQYNTADTILDQFDNPWELDEYDRARLIHLLLLEKMQENEERLRTLMTSCQSLHRKKQELEDMDKLDCMMDKAVIGMTITGASIYQPLLAQVKPAIVIVEEAAEVLEPQLIAVLGEWVQHLILIGDHNQLPPPVESYTLAKDYHFDISMMERLIHNNHRYGTLLKQNRMRPEFAELLSDIYPGLEDNLDRVERNSAPECMVKSMFFWNHSHKENKDRSVSNEGEAVMVVRLALYLIQQQYEPQQITILAAYQGQVRLLRRMVRQAEQNYPQLFQKTPTDESITGEKTAKQNINIQVTTIDFYQGDENEVVIVSLVRSNPTGQCGFLKKLNRRCVSQSRAKCGLYFVGNAETLKNNDHWKRMIEKMEKKGCVGSNIELCCSKHRDSSILKVGTAEQIPLGKTVCQEPCGEMMSCQEHICPRKCQPPHDHSTCEEDVLFEYSECHHVALKKCYQDACRRRCLKSVQFTNECGHLATRFCYFKGKVRCKEPCTKILECKGKHQCSLKCGDPCDPKNCPECAEIARAEAELQRKAEQEAREKMRKQTKKEIADLKKVGLGCLYRRVDLLHTGDSASEYHGVKDQVLRYIQAGQDWYPTVRAIEKITNVVLQKRWLDAKLKAYDLTTELKCRDVCTEKVDDISRQGFQKESGLFGQGLYFTSRSKLDFLQSSNPLNLHHILVSDVLVGKSKNMQDMQENILGIEKGKTTLGTFHNQGYDSIFYLDGNETCSVHHPSQVLPRYIVCYERCSYGETEGNVAKMEKEAAEFTHHHITPTREISPDDPLEHHFRMAESQFNRMAKGQYKVEAVDYYINPPLVDKFRKKQIALELKYGKGSTESKFILGFHGTNPENIDVIVKENFDVSKVQTCVYGKGIYFSEFPDVSVDYARGTKQLLLCKILPGKGFDVENSRGWDMKPLKEGYDSHRVRKDPNGCGWAIVIDNPDQILPCYVVTFTESRY